MYLQNFMCDGQIDRVRAAAPLRKSCRDDASNHRRPAAVYANRLRRVDRGRFNKNGESLWDSHSFCMRVVYRVNTTFQKAVVLQLHANRY